MEHVPYVPAHVNYPELTPKVLILGFLLAAILAASNAYIGLKMGRTVSGSIPAAVLSIAILKQFKHRNILEHNLIQTAASAGECLVAGIIFTIPALLMLGVWQDFHYLETFCISIVGGGLGIFFSVPLRKMMIVDQALPYPEGIAVAEVLKASEEQHATRQEARYLVQGGMISAAFVLCQSAFKLLGEGILVWSNHFGVLFGFGFGFSPVLLAAGYIVGMSVVSTILLGNILTWQIGMPLLSWFHPTLVALDANLAATTLSKDMLRYVSVGAITFGGLWGLISLCHSLVKAVSSAYEALCRPSSRKVKRTEQDIPISWVLFGALLLIVPLFFIFYHHFSSLSFPITHSLLFLVVVTCTILAMILGFIATAIAAYLVGLVGTTSLPISGLGIAAISLISVLLLGALGLEISFESPEYAAAAASGAIIFASIICLCASLGGDNMQDLRAGYILGATPWKQQVILFVGVLAGACVIAPVMELLLNAYGIGDLLPHAGMNPQKALVAPQASIMRVVAEGIFLGKIKMLFFGVGVLIAAGVVLLDYVLQKKKIGIRLPVLAFGLGMYLPMNLVFPLFVGGCLAFFLKKKVSTALADGRERRGILFAAGLIAGEAVMGIILAIPFSLSKAGENVFALPVHFPPFLHTLLGVFAFLGIMYALSRAVNRRLSP